MYTNFLTRVLTKAFTFILISTLLTLLIVTIHVSDTLSLDTSFSGDGMVTTFFSAGNDVGSGIALQSDDKIDIWFSGKIYALSFAISRTIGIILGTKVS